MGIFSVTTIGDTVMDEKAFSGFGSDFGGEKYFTIQSVRIWEPAHVNSQKTRGPVGATHIYPVACFEGRNLKVVHCGTDHSVLPLRNQRVVLTVFHGTKRQPTDLQKFVQNNKKRLGAVAPDVPIHLRVPDSLTNCC